MTVLARGLAITAVGAATGAAVLLALNLRAAPSEAPPDRDASSARASSGTPTSTPTVDDEPSALQDPSNRAFPPPLIELDQLIDGGPPPDGIPPIDRPRFEKVHDVTWLRDADPVLSLTVAGETRGYPIAIMTWHEIVNDEVGDTPVAVTYCPLCNSGVAFRRVVDGQLLDFGTSGKLYADNLVMYDRQTESLWPQLTGLASVGVMTGAQLKAIPMGAVGWAQFRAAHPDALVLSRQTGHDRDYGANPYVGYDQPDGSLLAPVPGGTDDRLAVKERVIGLGDGVNALAVVRSLVAESGVLQVPVGGKAVALWHLPGQASALDEATIGESRDIGTVAAFSPRVGARQLTWQRTGTEFVDTQTKSRWNIAGTAVAGPLKGTHLDPVRHLDTFWFAWVAFQPDTHLID